MMQPLLRHQIYESDKGKTFSEDDDCETTKEAVDGSHKEDARNTKIEEGDGDDVDRKIRINSEMFPKSESPTAGNLDFRLEKKKAPRDGDEVQSETSDGSELLNVDEESNQSGEFQKVTNVSPVDLTSRNLDFDRNRFKLNALLLRNRNLFNNCSEFRDNVKFFDGAAFQSKEDNYENGRHIPGSYDRGLEKEFGNVSDRFRDRFLKIEEVRHFNNEKLFLMNGKVKDVEERSESVNSNLSEQDLNGSLSLFRRDEKNKFKSNDKSQNFVSFQRFNYSPDRKSTSPIGEPVQPVPRRNLAFSVENILDPNKFTGNSPNKLGNETANLAALVSGQRLQGSLANMVSPVGCCWRPQLQDGESDRDDNSGENILIFYFYFKTICTSTFE